MVELQNGKINNPGLNMSIKKSFIHLGYWICASLLLVWIYGFIGVSSRGLRYALVGLPGMMLFSYLLIHKVVPSLLFRDHPVLFGLITATLFAGLLNIQVIIVLLERVFLAETLAFTPHDLLRDIVFMFATPLLVTFPLISFESLAKWKQQNIRNRQLAVEKDEAVATLKEIEQENEQSQWLTIKINGTNRRLPLACISHQEIGSYARRSGNRKRNVY